MKRFNLILIGLSLLFGPLLSAQSIAGSAHDFSAKSWNAGGEICQVCHTPHNAAVSIVAPLWNHESTTSVFTLYTSTTSPTLDAITSQPDGSSKLCLSCHDGTVALDNYNGNIIGTQFITGSKNLGTNISNDHPISFTYDDPLTIADAGLYRPSITNSGLGGTIAADLLPAGKVQCSSCHDVHNSSGVARLLVKSNAGSALCLTCHAK